MEERDWSSLPSDVLAVILERLRWSSHPSFALTCRHWRSAVSPFYPAWITPLLLSTAHVGVTNIRYYSPYYHKNFEVGGEEGDHALSRARGAKICCAAGRHLALDSPSAVLDVELVTGNINKVPHIYRGNFDFVIYDDRAYRIFGIDAVLPLKIGYANWNSDDGVWEDWTLMELGINGPRLLPSPVTNPVIHCGLIYLLNDQGGLVMYDPCKHDEGFEILDNPTSFGFKHYNSYLVESDQHELMAVLLGRRGTLNHVIKLNEKKMEWEKVESLQGRTLFTGTLTSMVKKTKFKWMEDRVFLPVFYKWPDTIHADLISRDDELAFVPKKSSSFDTGNPNVVNHNNGACCEKCVDVWSYKLGQQEEPRENWGAERVDYGDPKS
uniref:Uncharacterized protein n=1 Tax=Oryza rufipogon TaxID=4529 RepID=A0A0E0QQ22_ORYRU